MSTIDTAEGRTTLVLSPHQDDEASRLAAYVAIAADRGDAVELVQVTDGTATGVGRAEGLSPGTVQRWRDREQFSCWDWLTDGRGTITRLQLVDGAARAEDIVSALTQRLDTANGECELYVATWHHDRPEAHPADLHPDHIACVLAAREIARTTGIPVRFARHATQQELPGTLYEAQTHEQRLRIEGALSAYTVIGRRSVRHTFEAAEGSGGTSRITE